MKKLIIAAISIFVCWSIMDYFIHWVILSDAYLETSELWRQGGDVKVGIVYLAVLVNVIVFILIYQMFFAKKGVNSGILYGLIFGIGAGMNIGFGNYAIMPTTPAMASILFFGYMFEYILAGALLGFIVKE
jgi:hypothetical protein